MKENKLRGEFLEYINSLPVSNDLMYGKLFYCEEAISSEYDDTRAKVYEKIYHRLYNQKPSSVFDFDIKYQDIENWFKDKLNVNAQNSKVVFNHLEKYTRTFLICKDNFCLISVKVYLDRGEFAEVKFFGKIDECPDYEYLSIKYEKKKEKEIFYLTVTSNGVDDRGFEVEDEKVDVSIHYHNIGTTCESLAKTIDNSDKGLYILMGEPGTGKTSFLIQTAMYSDRKFMFLDSSDASQFICTPNFKDFMADEKKSVLVIEDAEKLIEKINGKRSESTSSLLNYIDGFMNRLTKVQIILTINTDISNVDSAFLRPGRLKKLIKFEKLPVENCNAIFESKKLDFVTSKDMTLAEVYAVVDEKSNLIESNIDIEEISGKRKSIGF